MMPSQVLLVESNLRAAAALEAALVGGGFAVTPITSFEAVSFPASIPRPDLMITAVRLGRFNGLHFAVRFRADYPGLPMIVVGDEDEVGLAAEAIRLQARFLPKSTPPLQLLEFARELIAGRAPRDLVSTRRWPRRWSALPASFSDISASVIDVGYGGLRLECPTPPAPGIPVSLDLPTVGMNLKGMFRWSSPAGNNGGWWCGVELDAVSTDARKWRRVVDSLALTSRTASA